MSRERTGALLGRTCTHGSKGLTNTKEPEQTVYLDKLALARPREAEVELLVLVDRVADVDHVAGRQVA